MPDSPLGQSRTSATGSAATMIQKELRRTAAYVYGRTGAFRTEDAEELLVEIHDRLAGISAAFADEYAEVWDA